MVTRPVNGQGRAALRWPWAISKTILLNQNPNYSIWRSAIPGGFHIFFSFFCLNRNSEDFLYIYSLFLEETNTEAWLRGYYTFDLGICNLFTYSLTCCSKPLHATSFKRRRFRLIFITDLYNVTQF